MKKIDSIRELIPIMFKYVFCCPAKDASIESSEVAEDLTATLKEPILLYSFFAVDIIFFLIDCKNTKIKAFC